MPEDAPHGQVEAEHLLGELEAAIMRLVWHNGEMTVREVHNALQPARRLAYTTVMTVMSRLARKGVLMTRRQGKAFYYRPASTPAEFVTQRAQRAVQDVLASYGDIAMACFLRELDGVDAERLARLQQLICQEPQDAN